MIGAGSWGTALALQFARAGCDVRLGGVVELDLLEDMATDRENKRYLPDAGFPPNLSASDLRQPAQRMLAGIATRSDQSRRMAELRKEIERRGFRIAEQGERLGL